MTAHDEFLVLLVPIYTPSSAGDTDHAHAAGRNVPTARHTVHRHPNHGFDRKLPWVFCPTKVKTLEGEGTVESIILLWSGADMVLGLARRCFTSPKAPVSGVYTS